MLRLARQVLHVCVFFVIIKVGFRLSGFQTTLRQARRFAMRFRGRSVLFGGPACEKEALRAISIAAAFFPARARCLEQSLALYYWLERSGRSPSLHFGVQPSPFRAHSWVTVDGVPIGETDGLMRFVPLPDLIYE